MPFFRPPANALDPYQLELCVRAFLDKRDLKSCQEGINFPRAKKRVCKTKLAIGCARSPPKG